MTPTDHMFVIDWDDGDAGPEKSEISSLSGKRPQMMAQHVIIRSFFQGYGQTEIDWVALTYYQCERVVQDVIENAMEVFFRDDLGAESKAHAAQLFSDTFAKGDTVTAAFAAAAHLPAELSFQNMKDIDDGKWLGTSGYG